MGGDGSVIRRRGRGRWERALASLVVGLTLIVGGAEAATVRVIDIDGTFVNDHGPDAGWRTYWTLVRIRERHSAVQPDPREPYATRHQGDDVLVRSPETLEISYAEYERVARLLGKGERQLGDLHPVALDADPLNARRPALFIPGFYRISADITFRRFRSGNSRSTNYPLQDYHDAVAREAQRGWRWRGPAFNLVRQGLLDAENVDSVVFSSVRDHLDEEFLAVLSAMQRAGEFAHVRGRRDGQQITPRFNFLQSPDAILVWGRDMATKKSEVVAEEARQLAFGPLAMHEEIVPDANGASQRLTARMHTLIVAEDDPRYVVAVGQKLSELSREAFYRTRVKFVLFNTGTEEEVTRSSVSRFRWTVFDSGFVREALPEEIRAWTGSDPTSCVPNVDITQPVVR